MDHTLVAEVADRHDVSGETVRALSVSIHEDNERLLSELRNMTSST
jgi:transcriptional regulator of NAD metabolism